MTSVSWGAAMIVKSPFTSVCTEFCVPFTLTVAPGIPWLFAWSATLPVIFRAPGGWADNESVRKEANRTPTKAVRFIWIFLDLVMKERKDAIGLIIKLEKFLNRL